jgi:hypothetical protein
VIRTKFCLEDLGADEGNIKMYLKDTGLAGAEYLHVAHDMGQNKVMSLLVP